MEELEALRKENEKLRADLLRMRRRMAEWALLADLVTRVSTTLEMEEIGAAVLDITWQVTGADCVVLWYHPRPEHPGWAHLAGPESAMDWWHARPSRRAPATAAAAQGRLVCLQAEDEDRPEGVSGYLALPLQAKQTLVGVLEAYNIPVMDRVEEYIETLRPALPAVSLALRNAQLYRIVHEHNEQLEARVAERTARLERQQEEDTALFCHLAGFSPTLYRRLLHVFPELNPSTQASAGEEDHLGGEMPG